MKILVIIGALALSGCAAQQEAIRDAGGRGLTALEDSSETVILGADRYLCETARVGPLLRWLSTEERAQAWQKLCNAPRPPISPQ